MAKSAGYNANIKCSGTALSLNGEVTSTSDNLKYQITNTAKQVLDNTATIYVHKLDSSANTAEAGTTSANLTFDGHGLSTNDFIYNTTLSAGSSITVVDSANVTLTTEIAGQTTGDSIDFYPNESSANYTLNRLSAYVEYAATASRTIKISGSYLPMTTIAQAKEFSYSTTSAIEESPVFGNTTVARTQLLNDFSASVSRYFADSTYQNKLRNRNVVVVECYINSALEIKAWTICSSAESSIGVDKLVEENLEFEGTIDADGVGYSFD